jgi:hypothetical protein
MRIFQIVSTLNRMSSEYSTAFHRRTKACIV